MAKEKDIRIGAIAIGIIILTILIAFFVSSTFRFILIGSAFVVMSFIILLGQRIKKDNVRLGLFLGLLGVGLILILSSGVLQSIDGGESLNIWTVRYGRLECQEDSLESFSEKWLDQQTTFRCGDDAVVDNCDFVIEKTGSEGILAINIFDYSICDINGNNCRFIEQKVLSHFQSYRSPTITINSGESLVFSGIKYPEYIKVTKEYNPYRLYTYEAGGKFLTNSVDCSLSSQDSLERENIKYGEWDTLTKGEFRNYFLDWVYTYTDNVYEYNNNNVLCRNQALYEIDSERLATGDTRYIQGEKVKNVECCPQQDNNCDSKTFEFVKIDEEEEVECNYDYQCTNAGDPYSNPFSSSSAYVEECVSNKCARSSIDIECERDSQCDDGYVCDLRSDNYGVCVKSSVTPYCGDGICQEDESFETCSIDCDEEEESTCRWFETEVTKVEKEYGFLWFRAYIPFVDPIETPVTTCKTSGWVNWVFISTIVISLGGFAIYLNFKKGKKK